MTREMAGMLNASHYRGGTGAALLVFAVWAEWSFAGPRLVRLDAHCQVIRMPMGLIGAWPGKPADAKARAHFDEPVRLGKAAGIHLHAVVASGQTGCGILREAMPKAGVYLES